jgi:Fe-S cluster assembly protein SufD
MQPNLDQLDGVTGVRAAALARWRESGWPDRKAEAWRFTRLSAIDKMDLRPALAGGAMVVDLPAALPEGAAVLSFHNGVLDLAGLASLPDGVTATRLEDDEAALGAFSALVPVDHPVSALSIAAMGSGICLDIAGHVKTPIVLAFGGDDSGLSAHPAVFVRVEADAAAVIAEWHQADVGLSAPLAAFDLGERARLDYAKVQRDSGVTTHLAATGLRLAERAAFDGFHISVGGRLARLETHVTLSGENADCTLSAIYLGRDSQHHDITTNMAHLKGHCNSNQLIRGVLDDSSRGVFQGKVHVAPDAQKTDGNQMSRALLLSRKAEADTKPELEIYADDVLCAHGATVGELDETQLFYLTSRGIPPALARAMLIEAFLEDAIDGIGNDQLAALLRPVVQAWMARGDEA